MKSYSKLLEVPASMFPEVRSSSEIYGHTDEYSFFGHAALLRELREISRRRYSVRHVLKAAW